MRPKKTGPALWHNPGQVGSTPEPGEKLRVEGAIEPQLLPYLDDFLRVDIATLIPTDDQQGDVPGHHVHQQEDQ
jgi:hypothetical protein